MFSTDVNVVNASLRLSLALSLRNLAELRPTLSITYSNQIDI